jgi:hypothetical protein
MRAAFQAPVADAAWNKRIDGDTRATIMTADNNAGGFMPQHERRRSPRVVAMVGMHIGAANSDRFDAD